jgi:small subunit ribosomal protein S17
MVRRYVIFLKTELKDVHGGYEKNMSKSEKKRDIGLDITPPDATCEDKHCPFHGILPVRGMMIKGTVVSDKMNNTVIVRREYLRYIPKYERYEKRRSRYPAHNPPCINAKIGDTVKIAECRPLSKTVSFVVVERTER